MTEQTYYTGVGSRDITDREFRVIVSVASRLANYGISLRSGKAAGADTAFQVGAEHCSSVGMEIYIPWANFKNTAIHDTQWDIDPSKFNNYAEAKAIAEAIHPAWQNCRQGARKLHTRNVYQVLGKDLNTKSQFLIACADEDSFGDVVGGTRTAWMLAKSYNIPILNIRNKSNDEISETMKELVHGA